MWGLGGLQDGRGARESGEVSGQRLGDQPIDRGRPAVRIIQLNLATLGDDDDRGASDGTG